MYVRQYNPEENYQQHRIDNRNEVEEENDYGWLTEEPDEPLEELPAEIVREIETLRIKDDSEKAEKAEKAEKRKEKKDEEKARQEEEEEKNREKGNEGEKSKENESKQEQKQESDKENDERDKKDEKSENDGKQPMSDKEEGEIVDSDDGKDRENEREKEVEKVIEGKKEGENNESKGAAGQGATREEGVIRNYNRKKKKGYLHTPNGDFKFTAKGNPQMSAFKIRTVVLFTPTKDKDGVSTAIDMEEKQKKRESPGKEVVETPKKKRKGPGGNPNATENNEAPMQE